MKLNLPIFVSAAVIAFLALMFSAYTVDQRQAVTVSRLGEIVAVHTDPGLYFRVPLVDSVRTYDRRIQTLDAKDPERIQTKEKNNVLVDSFVKYRIVDFKKFLTSTRGDLLQAELRLSQGINNDLRNEFGRRTLIEVVSGERDVVMETLRAAADGDARSYGIEVLDVRLKRVDLVPEISDDVYKRMDSERKQVAAETRSTGAGEAEKIRADADKQREVILAEAYRDAQKIKGEGDAAATKIYAAAFSKNAEFYSFHRSLEAYRNSLRNKSDVLVLDPSSDFFKYLKNPKGGR
jgi:modulator of FtsH protease HflC